MRNATLVLAAVTAAAGLALTACTTSPGSNAAGAVPTATQSWDCSATSTLSQSEWVEHCGATTGATATSSASATATVPAVQPINGGTYTWPNGITLTLNVQDYGPYGRASDLCGDGSCGVLHPDDHDLGIAYTVTVPTTYPGTFTPNLCPGSMTVANGNDDDAFVYLAGKHDSPITGPMLPGSTKNGIAEYVIETAYAGQQFVLSSQCAAEDYSEPEAIFTGNLG